MTCELQPMRELVGHPEFVLKPTEPGYSDEYVIPVEEQIENVKKGICLLELRDALQGIPDLVYPSVDKIAPILIAAEQAGVTEATVSIQTGDGLIIDKTTRELLLWMRENSTITPSFSIPSTAKGAEIAAELIENYHRGLDIKVFISAAGERMKAHGWTIKDITDKARQTIQSLTEKFPNNVVSVIEQASQASDENLFQMIDMSADANASGICLADTLSFFGEEEAFNFIRKVKGYIRKREIYYRASGDNAFADRFRRLRIEYHGHNDFGMASEAALGAMRAGAVWHGTPGNPAGIGERAGNASIKDTYRKANRFLKANDILNAFKPSFAVNALDAAFIKATQVDPHSYGPDGENANTTCAALHADYILKIWKRLEAAKLVLEAANVNATHLDPEVGTLNADGSEMTAQQMQFLWGDVKDPVIQMLQEQVVEYTRLLKEGYLPRRGDEAVGEHKFRLNGFSNEDTIRMYFHELTGLSPYEISQENIDYILWVIKDRNRPLTPLEMQELFGVREYPYGAYPWAYVDETHPQYQTSHDSPLKG